MLSVPPFTIVIYVCGLLHRFPLEFRLALSEEQMLFDRQASAADRRIAAGLQPPPDNEFAKDWDSVDVASQLVCFAAPYSSHQHPSSSHDVFLRALVGAPRAASTTELLLAKDKAKLEIERERARRNGEILKEKPPPTKDSVFQGPDFLYREPKVSSKPQQFTKNSLVIPRSCSLQHSMMELTAEAHFVDDDKSRAIRECRLALEEARTLRQTLPDDVRAAHRFFDASFFAGSKDANYPDGTPATANAQEPADAVRLSSLYPDALVFDPDPIPYALVGTTIHCHHVIAALEVLRQDMCRKQDLMDLLVSPEGVSAQDCVFDDGMIGVLIFVDGKWDWVIVDDIVGVDGSGRPLYVATVSWTDVVALEERFGCPHRPQGNSAAEISWEPPTIFELWPLLVVKGLAKRLGGYNALDGGTVREALSWLSGYVELPVCRLDTDSDTQDLIQNMVESPQQAVLLYPRPRSAKPPVVQVSSKLPCLVLGFDFGAECRVHVYSPWGSLRRHHAKSRDEVHYCLSLTLDEVLSVFGFCERFHIRDPCHPMVSMYSVSTPSAPTSFSLTLQSAIKTGVLVSVEQADPRVQRHLPYRERKTLPLGCLSWSVVSACGKTLVHASLQSAQRQVADNVELEPGVYCLSVCLDMCPSIPFRLSLSAPSTALITVAAQGADPFVHGVTTKLMQGCAPPHRRGEGGLASTMSVLDEVMTRRASRLLKPRIPSAIGAAFQWADFLQKGHLDASGAQQALLHYVLHATPAGQAFVQQVQNAIRTSQSGGVEMEKFNEIMTSFLDTLHEKDGS